MPTLSNRSLLALALAGLSAIPAAMSACERARAVQPEPPIAVHPAPHLPGGEDRIDPASLVGPAQAINELAFELYAKLRKDGENLFFSPASIHAALSLAWSGARGPTEQEMAAVLRLPPSRVRALASVGELFRGLSRDKARDGVTVSIANRFWGQAGLPWDPAWEAEIAKHFGADAGRLDFAADPEAARALLNDWVEDKTEGLITDLFTPGTITPQTASVIANAIYFKGDWERAFDAAHTREQDFFVAEGSPVQAALMFQTGRFRYAHIESAGVKLLELPYKGQNTAMLVVLPDDRRGLKTLESTITAAKLAEWKTQLRSTRVDVWLPKMELRSNAELKPVLAAMGMPTAFTQSADFTRANPGGALAIDAILHEAVVKVDEEGTEAAAVTAIITKSTDSVELPASQFRADHPFMFFIEDSRSAATLFMGAVDNPAG